MNEIPPTTKQVIIFTVLLSFVVSIIGTTLTSGILGGSWGTGDSAVAPFVFNRPKILERIIQGETPERVLRQDELVVRAVEEASPAVVSVVATKDVAVLEKSFVDPFADDPFLKQFFGGNGSGLRVPQFKQKGTEKQEVSAGTGFIISAEGIVLTNKHVVADLDAEYTVLLNDGRKKTAKILARDPIQDLAVLKIDGANNFPVLKLGDSSGVKIGQTVIAIGNALGEFRNTVSVGVVSGLQRTVVAEGAPSGPETLQELIQSDTAINPGNSGGPLLNIYGEAIAINTAVVRGAENIGFAIPINKAKRAIETVKKTGRIIYPFLGVRYAVITKELAEKEKLARDYGMLVVGGENEPAIIPGGPAGKAGLQERDILLELNRERLDSAHTLAAALETYQVGDEVTLKVFRNGKEIELKVGLEERK